MSLYILIELSCNRSLDELNNIKKCLDEINMF